MTGYLMTAIDGSQDGLLQGSFHAGYGTAWMKGAALAATYKTWRIAGNATLLQTLPVERWERGHEPLRIRMPGMLRNILTAATLHNLPCIENGDAITECCH